MSENEKSLADVVAEAVDTTPAVTPQDFSIEDFINGFRPGRRSILLYPRSDLIARLDEIATQINNTPEGQDVDDLIDEFERVKAEFRDGVWFTIEKRSSEWQKKFRLDTEKELGLKRVKRDDDDEPTLSDDEAADISVRQLAEQIVIPSGVTYAHLQRMFDTNEGELVKLLAVMNNVNGDLAEQAGVLTRDFSHRRSTKTDTQDS